MKLKALREARKKILDKIDYIVADGGYVGLGDPLSAKLRQLTNEINKLVKQ